jgi:glycosyltransferase involved in cell wall biosynthesis
MREEVQERGGTRLAYRGGEVLTDLSVLVCSMHARTRYLTRLLECLSEQPAELLARTQVLIDIDDAPSVGAKRQRMLKASKGRYVVFIDDDDLVTDDYLTELFIGIDRGVDHIGVRMLLCHNGTRSNVECSMHNKWETRDGVYLRGPQHVCAVKRILALKAGFPDLTRGEDKAYSLALTPLVKTEYLTRTPVYLYLWEPK